MKILIVGLDANLEEAKAKFAIGHTLLHARSHGNVRELLSESDVVFDFIIDQDPVQVEVYSIQNPNVVFLNSVMTTAKAICSRVDIKSNFFIGFNKFCFSHLKRTQFCFIKL